MRARVKADARFSMVTACGGIQFNRHEWANVPPGCEEEALRNPYLEVEDVTPESALDAPDAPEAQDADVDATPDAHELAYEFGVDLTQVQGSGKGGRILKRDVQAFIDARGA
ncbi:hypothetical protein D6833_04160 [Candidatus Parcubacteria bacterium]|nr:MAG: hypothetical protein D6833_04160 [Candidatus Parcubacteria bacterium]